MYRSVSWSFAYITDRPADWTGAGRRRWTCGRPVTRKLNALTPLNFHCQRHGDSVFCLPSEGPLLANEARVCSRLKVDAAMFGRETRRKRRWAHSQVTARDGRQGTARGGHQLEMQPKYERCVADAASSSSDQCSGVDSRHHKSSSLRSRVSSRPHTRRPTDRRVRPSLRPSAPLAGAHQPHMPK